MNRWRRSGPVLLRSDERARRGFLAVAPREEPRSQKTRRASVRSRRRLPGTRNPVHPCRSQQSRSDAAGAARPSRRPAGARSKESSLRADGGPHATGTGRGSPGSNSAKRFPFLRWSDDDSTFTPPPGIDRMNRKGAARSAAPLSSPIALAERIDARTCRRRQGRRLDRGPHLRLLPEDHPAHPGDRCLEPDALRFEPPPSFLRTEPRTRAGRRRQKRGQQ